MKFAISSRGSFLWNKLTSSLGSCLWKKLTSSRGSCLWKKLTSSRGSCLWKKLTTKETNPLAYDKLFKNITKNLLLSMENEITYF